MLPVLRIISPRMGKLYSLTINVVLKSKSRSAKTLAQLDRR